MTVHPKVGKKFHWKLQMSASLWCSWERRRPWQLAGSHLGTVWEQKGYVNLFNCCWDISDWTSVEDRHCDPQSLVVIRTAKNQLKIRVSYDSPHFINPNSLIVSDWIQLNRIKHSPKRKQASASPGKKSRLKIEHHKTQQQAEYTSSTISD